MVGELDVDGLAAKHGHHQSVVVHHGIGYLLCVHLNEGLFSPFQQQGVGDLPKGQCKGNDLTLSDITGELLDMDYSRGHACTSVVSFELLAVISIC